jgi:hypothetical protein
MIDMPLIDVARSCLSARLYLFELTMLPRKQVFRMEQHVLIQFAPGGRILREKDLVSDLPILRNGPPGTFVVFGGSKGSRGSRGSRGSDGMRVSLPTDQIIRVEDAEEGALVVFGGMRFEGMDDGELIFVRVRELYPEDQLSPDRSQIMRLEPQWVASIRVDGRLVWPV